MDSKWGVHTGISNVKMITKAVSIGKTITLQKHATELTAHAQKYRICMFAPFSVPFR
jgi:hypothetical protein